MKEVYTQERNRADGLVFFKQWNSYFTVSLEAKAYNEIKALRPQVDEYEFKYRRQIFWAIGGISYIFILIFLNAELLQAMLYWGCFVMGDYLLFHTNIEKKNYIYTAVFRQLEQYPANEQWLAVAEDCFNEKMSEEDLMKICKKANVGLLLVTSEGDVELLLNANKQKSSFLSFYSSDIRISNLLN